MKFGCAPWCADRTMENLGANWENLLARIEMMRGLLKRIVFSMSILCIRSNKASALVQYQWECSLLEGAA